MNYLEPDEIWKRFHVNSEIDFQEKYVLEARFHSAVPEKIIEEYQIVQRLLYYSYYYYPQFDEAFSKATRLFEASVTLKLEDREVKRQGFENLQSKLNRLKKDYSKELVAQWQHAKELRNIFAHGKAGERFGVFLANGFKHNLNLINTLFLDQLTIKEKEDKFLDLSNKSKHFEIGLFILNINGKNILVKGVKPYSTGILKTSNQSIWVFVPITGEGIITKSSHLPKSFILKLDDILIDNSTMTAIDSTSGKSIMLTVTHKSENLEKLNNHKQRMETLEATSPEISYEYNALLKSAIAKEISSLLYDSW